MHTDETTELFVAALKDRRLLDHPFYRRWEAGELSREELARYASQYGHFERSLPDVLSTIAAGLSAGPARDLVTANLADELGNPESHVTLFESFERAVGASADGAGPATERLVNLYRDASRENPLRGLAVVAAYEVQAGEIAASKGEGLRRHYGLDAAGTAFWDVHAILEADHAGWTLEALSATEDCELIAEAARASADAWWAFLDERQADAA